MSNGLVETLEIRIQNMSFVQGETEQEVHIRFSGTDTLNQISINGYVVAAMPEFFANSSSTETIVELVRTKLIERLSGGTTETEPTA